jgi:uncharacterized protein (AIM24 family)
MKAMSKEINEPLSLTEFLEESRESGSAVRFGAESLRILRVEIGDGDNEGEVWIKPGASIAYRGVIDFQRLPTFARGASFSETMAREKAPLALAVGRGKIWLAHHGYHLRVLKLSGETIFVAARELLAFEGTLEHEVQLIGGGIGLVEGGLFAVRLSGHGSFALAIHGDPLILHVTPEAPVTTDPLATLAWTDGVIPHLATDVEWRSLFRHGGGEPFQMQLIGDGYVAVQPSEDDDKWADAGLHPMRRLKSWIFG